MFYTEAWNHIIMVIIGNLGGATSSAWPEATLLGGRLGVAIKSLKFVFNIGYPQMIIIGILQSVIDH